MSTLLDCFEGQAFFFLVIIKTTTIIMFVPLAVVTVAFQYQLMLLTKQLQQFNLSIEKLITF